MPSSSATDGAPALHAGADDQIEAARERRQRGELVVDGHLDGAVQSAVSTPRAAGIVGRCVGKKLVDGEPYGW